MKYSIITFCLLLCISLVVLSDARAQSEQGGAIVPTGVIVNHDYTGVGETVEISGTINGDAYVVGGQVFINGTINGDLLAIGGTITISGSVSQNIRVLGGQVVVNGTIGRNATVAGMNVTFTDSAVVGGGVMAGGSNILMAGVVEKDARIAGRNLTMAGVVKGNVDASVENIRTTSGAEIGGDFTYWSNRLASIDENATINGTITRKTPQELPGVLGGFFTSLNSFLKPFLGIVSFFNTLILGLLLVRFFPVYSEAVVTTLRTRRWKSLTSGIAALLIIPVVFGLLIITLVGIPLGLLLVFLSALMMYLARIFSMVLIGRLIFERMGKKRGIAFTFFVGLLVYSLLVQIPLLGWVLPFITALFGLGAAIQTFKERKFG